MKRKKKFNLLKFIIFLLILYLLYYLSTYLFSIRIKNIVILNNNYYSDEEIIETLEIEDYPRFILYNRSSGVNKLKKLELIESAKIRKKYGFVLEVDVKEKKVLFKSKETNEYMCSDNIYRNINVPYEVPTLINYVPSNILTKFTNKFSKLDFDIISKISEIEYSKTSYDEERFLFYMNDYNNVYINISKLENMNKYVDIVRKLDNNKGILYLDSGNYFEIKE